MDLNFYRDQIDSIDEQLVTLFCRRMEISASIAAWKKANGLPIHVPAREQVVLEAVAEKAGAEMAPYTKTLYATLFELSKEYQAACNAE